jgi:hypothetical protein
MYVVHAGIVTGSKSTALSAAPTCFQCHADGRSTGLKIRSSQEGVGSGPNFRTRAPSPLDPRKRRGAERAVPLQISASRTAKFCCRYFVNRRLPPSSLQRSNATRMTPRETMATRRRVARRCGCGHSSHRAANTVSSISTKMACFRARSASVDCNSRSYFPGFVPVDAWEVGQAYLRAISNPITGRILKLQKTDS